MTCHTFIFWVSVFPATLQSEGHPGFPWRKGGHYDRCSSWILKLSVIYRQHNQPLLLWKGSRRNPECEPPPAPPSPALFPLPCSPPCSPPLRCELCSFHMNAPPLNFPHNRARDTYFVHKRNSLSWSLDVCLKSKRDSIVYKKGNDITQKRMLTSSRKN